MDAIYVTFVKTVLTEAMKTTFDAQYPTAQFRNLLVSIEFPANKENYPSIWVDWEPDRPLQIAGINHREEGDPKDLGGPSRQFSRWRFSGTVTFTIVAMSSLERDLLFDEVVKVISFGYETEGRADFRSYIENNEFIGMNGDFDQIEQRGVATSQGTPWGTDEAIYEITVGLRIIGEFVSDGIGNLVPLSAIEATPYVDVDPTTPGGWL